MSPRGRINVPSLDREQLTSLLVAVADIIITLDENYVLIGVTDPMNLDNLTLWKWTGRKIVDVVAPDSAPKISQLLRAETAEGASPDRWRHVNFLDASGANIPLLVKYFHLPAGQMTARLLVGRDLRPLEAAQQRFQRALADAAPQPIAQSPETGYDPQGDIDDLIGRKPFDKIVNEATEILERTFFAEALRRANGDSAAAAILLGLDEQDFLRRLRRDGTQ